MIELLPPPLRAKILVDDCWIWTGRIDGTGYGRAYALGSGRGSELWVHRLVYKLLVGPIERGNHLHHTCQNRRCCNPAHLEQITVREHVALHPRKLPTHCAHGHLYDDKNTGWTPRKDRPHSSRYCRECVRERENRDREKRNRYRAERRRMLYANDPAYRARILEVNKVRAQRNFGKAVS
jgi:hypothetical protein